MKQCELHIKCEVEDVGELTAFFVKDPPQYGGEEEDYWLPT